MNFITAIKTVLFKKYAAFNGRASRSEFWFFQLAYFLLALTISVFTTPEQWVPSVALDVLVIIPVLAVSARRLHDTGRSGWNQLWAITIIGLIPLLYWYCSKSSNEGNRFGSNPLLPDNIA